jgi:hypothetical protein
MQKYILIDRKRVYLHSIVSFEYNQEVFDDGEVIDRVPVSSPTRIETLTISLINGDDIVIEGEMASELAGILEENSGNVGSLTVA